MGNSCGIQERKKKNLLYDDFKNSIVGNNIEKFRESINNTEFDVKKFAKENRNLIFTAISKQNLEMTNYFLEIIHNYDLNQMLFDLIKKKYSLEFIKLLTSHGAEIDSVVKYCYNCNFICNFHKFDRWVNTGKNSGYSKYLKECHKCSQPFIPNKTIATPLIFACIYDRYDIAFFLIESGSKINIDTLITPLIFACKNNNTKLVCLLLKKGARLSKCISDPISPMEYAVSYKNTILIEIFNELTIGRFNSLDQYYNIHCDLK